MKILFVACLLFCVSGFAKEEQRKCKMGRDYWIYTPEALVAGKTYWLVVGVHGHKGNGKGAAGLSKWVEKMNNVIVIGPTFPSTDPYYQVLGGETDKQLIDLHKDLSKEFKLHEKMFIYGFSGGAQFCHRFAAKHDDKLIGVSAHSGGTWEDAPAKQTEQILWTLSCGLKDTQISAGGSMPRIDYFRNFYKSMNKGKFTSKPFVTEAGHSATQAVKDTTEECFRVASTGLFDYQLKATAGMTPSQRESWIAKDKTLADKEFNDGVNTYKLKVNQDGWTVGVKALEQMTKTRKYLDGLSK